jgi:hypothetical protein
MTQSFVRLLADAWGVFRREADLILRIAGALVFLPAFAVQVLCDPLPAIPAQPRDEAAMAAWIALVSAWGEDNALWYLLADLVGMVGLAAIALLLLAPEKPSVGEALRGAVRRIGRFVIANLLVAITVGLGLWVFVLPGLYFQARLIAVLPVIAAEPDRSAARAVGRSWQLTTGVSWAILGAVVALFLLQWAVVSPLFPLDTWLRAPGHDNPFLIALVAALLALGGAIYNVALLLLGVVSYRRFARSGT